jgi:hypothetical protein
MKTSLLLQYQWPKQNFVILISQFSKSYPFIFPPAGSHNFLNRFLDLIGAEAIFINLSRFKFLRKSIGRAKFNGGGLSLKLAHSCGKRRD